MNYCQCFYSGGGDDDDDDDDDDDGVLQCQTEQH